MVLDLVLIGLAINVDPWPAAHQDQAVVGLSLLLGLYLVGKSIYQLTT
ncbi:MULTISPECIES: hypothetical protein [unclassified Streptomyces]